MAVPLKNVSAPGYGEDEYVKTDTRAMTVATALFFMVGFLTCLNDVISPHLKSIFFLDYSQMQNVPFYFFSSCSPLLWESYGGQGAGYTIRAAEYLGTGLGEIDLTTTISAYRERSKSSVGAELPNCLKLLSS